MLPFSAHPCSVDQMAKLHGAPRARCLLVACALRAQVCTGAVSMLAQAVREVVWGLLGLRPEVVVTPIGFAPGSLWVHDMLTCSCQPWQHKEPRSCSKQGLDATDISRQGPAALGSDTTGHGRGTAHTSWLKASPPNPCPCDEVVLTQVVPILGGASACLAPTSCNSGSVRIGENFYFVF